MTSTERSSGNADEANRPKTALIVLAAGAGKRMHSDLAKPLHPVAGLPMVEHVLRAGGAANPDAIVLVASPQVEEQIRHLQRDDLIVVYAPPRGTGDAVRIGLDAVPDADLAIVLYADHPLLDEDTVRKLATAAEAPGVRLAVLTCLVNDAASYGRIDRNDLDQPTRIVEKENDDDPRLGVTEINIGMMALDAGWARRELAMLEMDPVKKEWLLTDLVERAVRSATPFEPWPVVTVPGSTEVAMGVNDRAQLAEAEEVLQARIRRRLMEKIGVTIRLPATVFIDADVEVGSDTEILPGTVLRAGTRIGRECVIGPNSMIERSTLGDRVHVTASVVRDAIVASGSDIGPFAHLRGGTTIGPNVHIGNFVEIKKSAIDSGVKIGHVSYLGDAHVGSDSNIGAGTITANFDGVRKHHTEIGANAFIGSDTMLVAPVTLGDGARTGAGSVVTRDVAPGETVVGVPARPRPAIGSVTNESGEKGR